MALRIPLLLGKLPRNLSETCVVVRNTAACTSANSRLRVSPQLRTRLPIPNFRKDSGLETSDIAAVGEQPLRDRALPHMDNYRSPLRTHASAVLCSEPVYGRINCYASPVNNACRHQSRGCR